MAGAKCVRMKVCTLKYLLESVVSPLPKCLLKIQLKNGAGVRLLVGSVSCDIPPCASSSSEKRGG